MKKLRVTYSLVDEAGEALHSSSHDLRVCEGVPGARIPLMSNGSGLQMYAHAEAERFWKEVVLLGLLDEYIRDRHSPMLTPPLEGDAE